MKAIWKIVGVLAKLVPAKTYKKIALRWIEKKSEPEEKEVIGPKQEFIDHGPSSRRKP